MSAEDTASRADLMNLALRIFLAVVTVTISHVIRVVAYHLAFRTLDIRLSQSIHLKTILNPYWAAPLRLPIMLQSV